MYTHTYIYKTNLLFSNSLYKLKTNKQANKFHMKCQAGKGSAECGTGKAKICINKIFS